ALALIGNANALALALFLN
ncbi:unnamed protein product, partial [Rotaria sp. Silwood1]